MAQNCENREFSILDKFLTSVGDKKYTTFFSKDFSIRNTASITEINNNDINIILNLTFFPYILG